MTRKQTLALGVLACAIAVASLALFVEQFVVPAIQSFTEWSQRPGVCFGAAAGQETERGPNPLVLNAPDVCEDGVLVRLDIGDSDVEGVKWSVIPETENFEVIENGRRAFFSSPDSGAYLFIVAGAKGGEAYLVHHTMTVEGSEPNSNPGPPSLTPKVRRWVADIPGYAKKDDHKAAVADVFNKLADSDVPIADMLQTTALSNTAVVGSDFEKWRPFFDQLGRVLDDYVASGQLETREDYRVVWKQIAKGLQ